MNRKKRVILMEVLFSLLTPPRFDTSASVNEAKATPIKREVKTRSTTLAELILTKDKP